MNKLVLWLNQVGKEDSNLVGTKAANIGEMLRLQLPVPKGFVITKQGCEQLLQHALQPYQDDLKNLNTDNTQEVQRISQQVVKAIQNSRVNEEVLQQVKQYYKQMRKPPTDILGVTDEYVTVSVRISPIEQLTTLQKKTGFLGLKGSTQILGRVLDCLSQLYTPQAMNYRAQQGLSNDKVNSGVIVQEMITSSSSGLMRTVMPTGDTDAVRIEAIFGLGEPLVTGKIEGDVYIVNKQTQNITSKMIEEQDWKVVNTESGTMHENVNPKDKNKQKVSDPAIKHLLNYGKLLESHFKSPQDVKWATTVNGLGKESVFLLQTTSIKS